MGIDAKPGGTESELEQQFNEMLDRMGAAGWMFGGSIPQDGKDVQIGMGIGDPAKQVPAAELVQILELLEEGGTIKRGFEVSTEPDDQSVSISYEGPFDEDFAHFVDLAVNLGQSLQ